MASPIPCDAPVMMATFCSAPMISLHLLVRRHPRRFDGGQPRDVRFPRECPLFGRHSSAPRTNGTGPAGLARQLLEITLQPGPGEIDEGAHLRHVEATLRGEQMHRQRRMLV